MFFAAFHACVSCLPGVFSADGRGGPGGRRVCVHLARCVQAFYCSLIPPCVSTASAMGFVLSEFTLFLHQVTPPAMQRNASFFCFIAVCISLCGWFCVPGRNRVVPVDVRRHTTCVDTAIRDAVARVLQPPCVNTTVHDREMFSSVPLFYHPHFPGESEEATSSPAKKNQSVNPCASSRPRSI